MLNVDVHVVSMIYMERRLARGHGDSVDDFYQNDLPSLI